MKIPKRSTICQACLKPFETNQEIVSQLTVEFVRKDTCQVCYTPAQVTTWRQKYQQKVSISEDDKDEIAKAWELLTASKGEEAYILAMFLLRKKILAKRGKEGLYEHLETGEMILVEEVNLKNSSISDLHAQLQTKMR